MLQIDSAFCTVKACKLSKMNSAMSPKLHNSVIELLPRLQGSLATWFSWYSINFCHVSKEV